MGKVYMSLPQVLIVSGRGGVAKLLYMAHITEKQIRKMQMEFRYSCVWGEGIYPKKVYLHYSKSLQILM